MSPGATFNEVLAAGTFTSDGLALGFLVFAFPPFSSSCSSSLATILKNAFFPFLFLRVCFYFSLLFSCSCCSKSYSAVVLFSCCFYSSGLLLFCCYFCSPLKCCCSWEMVSSNCFLWLSTRLFFCCTVCSCFPSSFCLPLVVFFTS